MKVGGEDIVAASLRAGRRLTWEEYGCQGVFEDDKDLQGGEKKEKAGDAEVEMNDVEDSGAKEDSKTFTLPLRERDSAS